MSKATRPEIDGISSTAFEALRTATLNNNLVWLRSFGCEVRHYENLIHVDHPQLRDYSAWLVFGPPKGALARLEFVVDEIERMPNAHTPDIYLDEALYNSSLNSALSAASFKCNYLSLTMASLLNTHHVPLDLTLQKAKLGNFEEWLSIYSEGFNRHDRDEEIDRSRWLRAFESGGPIQHWFVLSREAIVGICQTCTACDVVGIYSFTLKPAVRGLRHVRATMRGLRQMAAEERATCIYFERLFPENLRSRRRMKHASRGTITVRRMIGYRRPSDFT